MMDEMDKNELLEQYLLGQLTGELLTTFEEKLAADETFRREVALERVIRKNVRRVGRQEWALRLENFHQEMNETVAEEAPVKPLYDAAESKRSFSNQPLFFAIAATAALLLVATVVFTIITKKADPNRIFTAYYEPYQREGQTTRSIPNSTLSDRSKAFEFYKNRKYSESIQSFETILAKGEDEEVLFYLGNAYLAANQPQEAEEAFKKYLNKYEEFEVEAKWYLSLSYLKQNKVAEARPLLKELAQQDNDFHDEANKILKSLKTAD